MFFLFLRISIFAEKRYPFSMNNSICKTQEKDPFTFRLAEKSDLDELERIYETARAYMKNTGNAVQWGTTYPEKETTACDIAEKALYIMEKNGNPCACFTLLEGEDPTYTEIDGKWLNDEPYAAVHRVASDGSHHGVVKAMMDFVFSKFCNIKIDTHGNNKTMQKALKNYGFKYTGIIITTDGTPRLAFQLKK